MNLYWRCVYFQVRLGYLFVYIGIEEEEQELLGSFNTNIIKGEEGEFKVNYKWEVEGFVRLGFL